MGLDLPAGGHLTHGFMTDKKRVSATSVKPLIIKHSRKRLFTQSRSISSLERLSLGLLFQSLALNKVFLTLTSKQPGLKIAGQQVRKLSGRQQNHFFTCQPSESG